MMHPIDLDIEPRLIKNLRPLTAPDFTRRETFTAGDKADNTPLGHGPGGRVAPRNQYTGSSSVSGPETYNGPRTRFPPLLLPVIKESMLSAMGSDYGISVVHAETGVRSVWGVSLGGRTERYLQHRDHVQLLRRCWQGPLGHSATLSRKKDSWALDSCSQ